MKPPLIDGKGVVKSSTPILDGLALKIGWCVILLVIGSVAFGFFWLICAGEGLFFEWLWPSPK
jgi:hypothetical protein